jgi:hypothetical protein
MLRHGGKSALQILGSPDDLKFRSCVTLFAHAAPDDEDRSLFKQALDQFYEGKSDPRTEQLLRRWCPEGLTIGRADPTWILCVGGSSRAVRFLALAIAEGLDVHGGRFFSADRPTDR